jgi:Fe-S cluster assembly protein SufD
MNPPPTSTVLEPSRPGTHRVPKDTHSHHEQFRRWEKTGAAQQPSWLWSIRQAGLARFAERGFPTLQEEDWRFTNVDPIARLPFRPILEPGLSRPVSPEGLAFSSLEAIRLVFVDGHFSRELSSGRPGFHGAIVTNLAAALREGNVFLENHFSGSAGFGDNSFACLNDAFFADGAFIHVPAGGEVPVPVHLLHIATAGDKGSTFHLRHLILAEAGSQVTVLESYVSTVDNAYFTNAITDLVVGDGATVEYCKFQDESISAYHVAGLHARLGRACRFAWHSVAAGARLSRNNIRTRLQGEGLECVLNGLYLAGRDQVVDHHMIVEHASPNCVSHEYFNGILDDRARGIFHGRILVQPEAQKTDAKQTNKNLLLSDEATANTKPQLEIYADDVKCTHGATIGQLSDDSIFYLQTRGIGPERARRMLIHAFAGEIIERIHCQPIRDQLDQLIWNRLEEHEAVAVDKRDSAHV